MTRNGSSTHRMMVLCMAGVFGLLLAIGCGEESSSQADTDQDRDISLSRMARQGEELFNANCSVCHGAKAAGTNQGPTLIDRIYHPGHHSDASIRNAVSRGVQQHHWVFGDMAPVAGVSEDDLEKIICYVRELQRAAEIFEGDDFQTLC